MIDEYIEVLVSGSTVKWYQSLGYKIPTKEVQLWANIDGKRVKNGKKNRVVRGTKINVRVCDLPPSSNEKIKFVCETCGKESQTTWGAYQTKKSNNCKSCQAKKGFKGGCQSYWVEKLISNNPNACCDISKETDKRFLELHHLNSKSSGGKNEEANYVILCSNYHRAFHNWMGGSVVSCTAEDYALFKELELSGQKPTRKKSGVDIA